MHPSILFMIAQQQTRSCPCGATPEYPYGMCRKCYAGMVWRRRKTGSSRRATHRRRGRQARERARILTLAGSMFGASGKGADL